jgi:hypothetical protein
MTKPLLAILLLLHLTAPDVAAHSGGLDSNGCHAGSQPYHCHRSPSEMVGNRLRCDLGSKSKECENTYGSPSLPSQDYSNDVNQSEPRDHGTVVPDEAGYVYLDCRDGRTEDESFFGYVRVTPEKAIANLNKFYKWRERKADVDLDYYSWGPVKLSRSKLVLEYQGDKNQCVAVPADKMERIRLQLISDKKSKQKI